MSSFDYFSFLAGGTAEFLVYFGFLTLPLLLVAGCLVVWALRRGAVSRGRILLACIAPAIIPICVLIIGVAFVRPEATAWGNGKLPPVTWSTRTSVDYPQTAISLLMCLHLPVALGLGWCASPEWPSVLAATIWWGWVSTCASIMACMSISGNWL